MKKVSSQITCPVAEKASRMPHAIAMRDSDQEISYAKLDQSIDRTIQRLERIGISKNDRVAFLSANSIDYVLHIFALIRMSASFVPINLRWSSENWRKINKETNCKILLADSDHFEFSKILDTATYPLSDETESGSPARFNPDLNQYNLDYESEVSVVFTSGTSGTPKGARLSYGNFYFSAAGSNQNISLIPGDCWLASIPFYHVGGIAILFRCFLAGTSVHTISDFGSESLQKCLTDFKITHVSLVPVQMEKLIDENPAVLTTNLKCILIGGAPISKNLIKKCLELKLPICTTYGMTETASQITTLSLKDTKGKMETAGKPLPYREIRIEDSNGNPFNKGKVGQVAVKGKVVFKGYLDNESVNTEQTWFRTGDFGYLDDDGYLNGIERMDDLIISGGENIYSKEIEKVASCFPGVKLCAAIGIKNNDWGERPALFVECEEADKFSNGRLECYLLENLPKLLVPEYIFTVKVLPRTAIGKIDKKELKQLARSLVC